MDNIFATTRGEIDDFIYQPIEVVPGYLFNQYDTIRRCHLYLNSRFLNDNQYQGQDKIFYNIVKYRRDIAAKFLNIDTKDIRLWEMNPKSKWSTFLLEKELKLWLKKNKFGKILNQAAVEAPSFGSVVFKKNKRGVNIVDLRRLFLDPTVDTITNSRFITVKHLLTSSELRAKAKDGWDAEVIEQIITTRENEKSNAGTSYEKNSMTNIINSSPYFEIYERFGEVPERYLTGKMKDDKLVRSLFIIYDPYSIWKDDQGNYKGENGKVLFKSKWIGEYPFKDYHYSKTMGRWLGIGVVEDLFEAQERRNELVNQKRVSMEISSIHIFQTTGKSVVNNILSDLRSGDLIQGGPDGLITPLANEERNLSAFSSEEQDYDMLADKLSFANSQASGEPLPASTPATTAVISQNNTTSLFGFKRENLALTLTDLFNTFILPQCLKDLTDEHILRFTGTPEELNKLDIAYVDVMARDYVFKSVLEGGRVPSQEEVDMYKQNVALTLKKEGGTRFVNVAEKFYDDTEFEFDIIVDNEQENVSVTAQNMFQILTAVGQNPGLLQDPVTKQLIYEYASKIGINPIKLEVAESTRTPMQSMQSQDSMNLPGGLDQGGQQEVGRGLTAPVGLGGK